MDLRLRNLERKALGGDKRAEEQLAIAKARIGLAIYRPVRSGGVVVTDLMGLRVWKRINEEEVRWGCIVSVYTPSVSIAAAKNQQFTERKVGRLRCIIQHEEGFYDDQVIAWKPATHPKAPPDPQKAETEYGQQTKKT